MWRNERRKEMLIGQELKQNGETLVLTNHFHFNDCLRQNYEEKKDSGKGFIGRKKSRRIIGYVPAAMMKCNYLLKEGMEAELRGEDVHADKCYREFFRRNPEFRASRGGI
jgi:hypothetical protein